MKSKNDTIESRAITSTVALGIQEHLLHLSNGTARPMEVNDKLDKVDFEFTVKGKHYWMVLLREDKLSKGSLWNAN